MFLPMCAHIIDFAIAKMIVTDPSLCPVYSSHNYHLNQLCGRRAVSRKTQQQQQATSSSSGTQPRASVADSGHPKIG